MQPAGPQGGKTGMAFANAMIPGNVYKLGESSTDIYINMRWRDYEFYFGDSWKVNRKLTVDYGFRYSLLFTPYVPTGNATNFQPSLYDPNKPATDACNGLWVVPGKDPCGKANAIFGLNLSSGTRGPNKYLADQNYHLIAPRLGIAYDIFGDGKTAIRAGLGQFFQREKSAETSYIQAANAPFSFSASNITPHPGRCVVELQSVVSRVPRPVARTRPTPRPIPGSGTSRWSVASTRTRVSRSLTLATVPFIKSPPLT